MVLPIAARRLIARWLMIVLALSQIRATCVYSPPPVLSHGQGADTVGARSAAVGAEAGWGAVGSWWDARNVGDPEVTARPTGAARLRLGLGENLDLGIVGGVGPQRSFVAGPELKWRFAHLAPAGAGPGAPRFNAALISGVGVGSAQYPYEDMPPPRHLYVAPYTGVLASGGIEVVQMLVGLRFAASETFGNSVTDLTLYPVLAFGVQLRPSRAFSLFAEGDLAGGITTRDSNDTAVIGYVTAGLSYTFDGLWSPPK